MSQVPFDQPFIPANELERKLLDAQAGQVSPQELIAVLLKSELFMPVYEKHAIAGFSLSQSAKPLLIAADGGEGELLVLFTSPDRAKAFVQAYPGYGGGLLVELSWILDKAGVGYGISLNPGLEVGLELEMEVLRQLAAGSGG